MMSSHQRRQRLIVEALEHARDDITAALSMIREGDLHNGMGAALGAKVSIERANAIAKGDQRP